MDKIYTSDQIEEMGLSKISVADFESNPHLFAQLLPYVEKRLVEGQFYNVEKMIRSYDLPANSHIVAWGTEGVELWGTDENGETVKQEISDEEIERRFIVTKLQPYYIWKEDEEYYWRKNYDLQDWIYNVIEGVDNTGYYILNEGLISEINNMCETNIPEKNPTEESALFYWEWY